MVHTAITDATKTATAVTDLTEPVSFDASMDGKEEPAKMVQKGLSKCICIYFNLKVKKDKRSN